MFYILDEYNGNDGGVCLDVNNGTNYDTIGLTCSKYSFNESSANDLKEIMNGNKKMAKGGKIEELEQEIEILEKKYHKKGQDYLNFGGSEKVSQNLDKLNSLIQQKKKMLIELKSSKMAKGGGVEKPKRKKFLLYTKPNNETNRGYIALGEDVREVLRDSREYPGSYYILYQGTGTNDDLQKVKSMFSNYSFDSSIEIMETGGAVLGSNFDIIIDNKPLIQIFKDDFLETYNVFYYLKEEKIPNELRIILKGKKSLSPQEASVVYQELLKSNEIGKTFNVEVSEYDKGGNIVEYKIKEQSENSVIIELPFNAYKTEFDLDDRINIQTKVNEDLKKNFDWWGFNVENDKTYVVLGKRKYAKGGGIETKKIKWKPSKNEKVEGYVAKSFPYGGKGDMLLTKTEFVKKWSPRIESWIGIKPNLSNVETFFLDYSMDFKFIGSDANSYRIYSPGESAKSKQYVIQKLKANIQMSNGGEIELETPKVYIEDYDSAYSGKSYGQWLDLSNFKTGQDVMDSIGDIANDWSKRKGEKVETISVTDYENIPRSLAHEWMSSKDYDFIVKAYDVAKQKGIPLWVIGDVLSDYSDSFEQSKEGMIEFIDENYLGYANTDSDLAYDYIEQNGGIKNLAEEMIKRNFDYDKYGRDTRLGMSVEEEKKYGYNKLDDFDLGKQLVEQYSDIRELPENILKTNFNYKLFGDYLSSFYNSYGGYYFRN